MASNAWSGNEFIREGTVVLSNNNALGTAGTTFLGALAGSSANAALQVGDGITNSNSLTVETGGTGTRTLSYGTASGTGTQLGNITLSNNLAFNVASGGTLLFGGTVAMPANSTNVRLAVDGGGTVISTGNSTSANANSYQVRIGNGTLVIGNGTLISRTNVDGLGHGIDLGVDLNGSIVNAVSTLRASNSVTISNSIYVSTVSSQARVIGASGADATPTFSGPIGLNNAALTINSSNTQTVTVSGAITNFSGTGSLIKTGAGTATLSGANTYSGGTLISVGTLQIGNGGTTGSLSTSSTITNNGVLVFNRSDNIAQGTNFSASAISGSGSLVKNGAGTLTLTGVNTYTGGITINAGTVSQATSASSLGTGMITLGDSSGSSNATLMIASALAVANPITVAAGSSGTLRITVASSLAASSYTGPVTLNNQLTLGNLGASGGNSLTIGGGGITGSSNIIVDSAGNPVVIAGNNTGGVLPES
jgi:autotransporter-associated beta strand protein